MLWSSMFKGDNKQGLIYELRDQSENGGTSPAGCGYGEFWVIQSSECCHLKGKYYAFLFYLSFSVQYRCWCM